MKNTGIVLSGGGARCYGHLGLLAVLDEMEVVPSAISGVSGGAMVGALYASGMKAIDILDIARKSSFTSLSRILWRGNAFFSMEAIGKLIREYIPQDRIEKLPIRFFLNATDFTHNETLFFSEGPLWENLLASASVPLLFKPVRREGAMLVDGGLLNNLPVEPLAGHCTVIIGSHVNRQRPLPEGNRRLSRLAVLERSFHMAIATTVYERGRHCQLLLEPPLQEFSMFDLRNPQALFEISYRYASEHRQAIADLVLGEG
ncbi:MAG: patatin-like phospholipase family protein [Bacteroidota bacterium]|nr:patatin-like phospholipase family protein [Bacteroidota bacterium]